LLASLGRFSEKLAVLGAHAEGDRLSVGARIIGPALIFDPSSTLWGRFLERPRAVIGFAGSDLQNVVSRSALNSLTCSVL
jgi:hypothetical protein